MVTKLAIVFTDFFLFLPSFSLLLFTHFWDTQEAENLIPSYFDITKRNVIIVIGPGVLACATCGGGSSEADQCFGPGVLACATRGGGRSEAGHCFHLLSSFFLFLLLSSSFFLLRLLLFTHFGESPVRGNLFSPIFWHN